MFLFSVIFNIIIFPLTIVCVCRIFIYQKKFKMHQHHHISDVFSRYAENILSLML